jgi:hypothetical protein
MADPAAARMNIIRDDQSPRWATSPLEFEQDMINRGDYIRRVKGMQTVRAVWGPGLSIAVIIWV